MKIATIHVYNGDYLKNAIPCKIAKQLAATKPHARMAQTILMIYVPNVNWAILEVALIVSNVRMKFLLALLFFSQLYS